MQILLPKIEPELAFFRTIWRNWVSLIRERIAYLFFIAMTAG